MKKLITAGIATIACVALCATLWPRNAEDGVIRHTRKTRCERQHVNSKGRIAAYHFLCRYAVPRNSRNRRIYSREEQAPSTLDESGTTDKPKPTSTPSPAPKPAVSSAPLSSDPKPGTIAVVDGNRCMWVPGFGWVKDEGGGSQGTMVVSPDDELTGNKVGQMGGGTIVDGKGDINKQVGIMGADNTQPSEKHNPAPGAKAVIDGKPSV